jgi:hypothetical protein
LPGDQDPAQGDRGDRWKTKSGNRSDPGPCPNEDTGEEEASTMK